ncbi:glutathione S-transferase-like [Cimex lectularius]|uniref:glutathione transferase n=1 Tax=Cimex lectularius TaxID=79782 RepID=A0A8I6TI31_CIMLE|nr:glutathione S-transferase-like [Cimex lectularius]XP_014262362.1 glutathione S-transferase-like [Cimex lectularius]
MTVRLSYFNMTGLGEPIRLLLSYGNIKFEDRRVSKEDWPEMKRGMRWNQLPKLEIEGRELSQSKTICRYLAKKLNLCGKNEWDATYCDMMVDMLDDFRSRIVTVYYTPDSEQREKELEKLRLDFVPTALAKFEEQVAENGGFFVGGKLTWPDIVFLAFTDYAGQMLKCDVVSNFPKLSALCNYVMSQPGISRYFKTRPPQPEDMRKIFAY